MNGHLRGILWALVAVASFALMGLLVKAVNLRFAFSAAELVFWRTMPAIFLLGLAVWRRGGSLRTPLWKLHLGRSISGAVSMTCFFYALSRLPLATAVTLSYTSSLSLALLSFLLLGEKIRPLTLAALGLGLAGVILLLQPQLAGLDRLGLLSAIASSLLAGWAYLQLRAMGQLNEPSWRIVFYFSVISTLLSAALASISGWHGLSWAALPQLAGICLSALLGQLALTNAYRVGEKFTVAALSYLTVVFSATFAHYYFNEALGWSQILAMSVIIGAGILSAMPPKNR